MSLCDTCERPLIKTTAYIIEFKKHMDCFICKACEVKQKEDSEAASGEAIKILCELPVFDILDEDIIKFRNHLDEVFFFLETNLEGDSYCKIVGLRSGYEEWCDKLRSV